MSVEVATTPNFRALTPRELFALPLTNRFDYDVSPDGAQFLMLKAASVDAEQQTELRVVVKREMGTFRILRKVGLGLAMSRAK